MRQGEAAKGLGVYPGTLARWERGEREPVGVVLGRVRQFLDDEKLADVVSV
jgi:transcriptional regulator with XRE-family HTH domain